MYGAPAEQNYVALAQQYLPAVTGLLLPNDPFERRNVLKAKIENYEGMKRRFPLAAVFYDNELRKLRAKLKSTERQIAKAEKGEESTQVYRTIGWVAGIAAVGVLLTLAYKNVASARRGAS